MEVPLAELIRAGRIAYPEAHALQLRVLDERIAGRIGNTAILLEHDPVFTVGRKRGANLNVLTPGEVPVIEVERGGDVTFHGPGQLVVYPVFALEGPERDLHAWLRRLEALTIAVLAEFALIGERDARNTGVWVGGRKICSIGIACRRWVTWHGLALNVSTDLTFLSRIHPCGLDASVYTTMERELSRGVALADVQAAFEGHLRAW